jgi:UDP-N-acetylmuramoyl-L-alanyl-D-glutamate--2,6-diaminopimelate ligase
VIGGFNISNLLAVLSGLVCSGISFEKVCGAISGLTHPQGRLQKVRSLFRRSVYVDYAHTPDALKSVLATLKGLVQFDGRLITVFGAGGDRDKNKRPMMGNVVLDYSDIAIVTSDNPRYENPLEISEAIVVGNKNRFMIDLDRRSAIRRAIDLSGEADIVLIAGKGHEKYQEVAGKRFSFDDYLEAESYLNDMYSGSIKHEGCLNV